MADNSVSTEMMMEALSKIAQNAEGSGLLEVMPFACDESELMGIIKMDVLSYLLALPDPERAIPPGGIAFINQYLEFDFDAESIEDTRKQLLGKMRYPISLLLAYFIKYDLSQSRVTLADTYLRILFYIAIDYLLALEDPSFEEAVRYYRYGIIAVRIIERIKEEEIDLNPFTSNEMAGSEDFLASIQQTIEEDDFDDEAFLDVMEKVCSNIVFEDDENEDDTSDESEEFSAASDTDNDDTSEDSTYYMPNVPEDDAYFKTQFTENQNLSCKPIDHCLFRELYHKYVLIYQNPLSCGMSQLGFGINPGDNCVLAYGYVDHTAGLSFHVLCSACETKEGMLRLGGVNDNATLTIRYSSVKGNVRTLGGLIPNEAFFNKVKMVNEGYKTNADLEILRDYADIDMLRHPAFPDDMLVRFIREGLKGEEIWCRMEGIAEHLIVGVLLNEPYGDFGVHEGDRVGIITGPADGKMVAVAKL